MFPLDLTITNVNVFFIHSNNDRPTLTKVRYLVQPTWWRNLDQNDPSLLMDVNAIDSAMSEAAQYYLDMSWGKMEITYEILPQRKLDITSWKPKLYGVKRAVENAVANQGYVEGVDYDAIIFLYHPARRGDLKDSTGAKGQTNGNFIWAGVDSISYKIFRHEIGKGNLLLLVIFLVHMKLSLVLNLYICILYRS